MVNVVNWSGGHDSTVMLHYLLYQRNLQDFKVMFVDSTITVPETLTYIQQIVKLFGIEKQFVTLTPPETFFDRLDRYHFWPSIRALWCRKILKLDCIKKYYLSFKDEPVTEFIGIALSDSGIRAKLYRDPAPSRKWGPKIVEANYPMLGWGDEQKKNYMQVNGIPKNPVYKTFGLSGCFFCPYYHKPDFLRLKKYYPDLFEKLCFYEQKFGKRALPDLWISSLK